MKLKMHQTLKMTDKLYKLDSPGKLDTQGWNINFQQLLTPKRGVYPYIFLSDNFHESTDKRFACLFYTIHEYRMGSQVGLIGLFENKNNAILIANPTDQWFYWQGDRSLTFSDNFFFIRRPAYNPILNIYRMPFVIFDLDKKVFGFVDFDATSIYYSTLKVNQTVYQFNLDTPEELNENAPNRHGETFDLTTIHFYSFDKLNKLLDIYFDEKK